MNSKDCHWRYHVSIEFSVPHQFTRYQSEKYERKITQFIEQELGGQMEIFTWVPRPCLPGSCLDDINRDQSSERREKRKAAALQTALRKAKINGATQ